MVWVQIWPWIMVHLGVAWGAAWVLGCMPELGEVGFWRFRIWMDEPLMAVHFLLPWLWRRVLQNHPQQDLLLLGVVLLSLLWLLLLLGVQLGMGV